MIVNHFTIWLLQFSYQVVFVFDCCSYMEKLGSSIPFLNPSDFISLSPIDFCCSKSCSSFSVMACLKFHSSTVKSLNSSMVSSKERVILTWFKIFFRLDSFCCQHLSTFLKFLNFEVISFALSTWLFTSHQPCWAVWRKEGSSSQWFSNLKTCPLGIEVETVILQGQWSEVCLTKELTKVSG